MKRLSRLLASLGLAIAAFAFATPANAYVTSEGYQTYHVQFVDSGVHSNRAGAIDADLRLHANADGIVNGYQRYDGSGPEIALNGSRDGNRISLQSLSGTFINLYGTFDHGKIVGSGYLGNREVDFIATPSDPNAAT